MPDTPTAQSPTPEGPLPGPKDNPPPLPAADKPSRRVKILTPLVLAILGLALFLLAIILYPSATGVRTPLYSRLGISTKFPIALLGLSVVQISPGVAEMKITVKLPANVAAPPAGAPPAGLVVAPALGTVFRNCPPPFCRTLPGVPPGSVWGVPLAFRSVGPTGEATADFYVKARSFGVASNGVNASAAIPEVLYQGPGKPIFVVGYHIPSAASYDWSSFPTAGVSNNVATWQEDLVGPDTPGRAAIGINPAGQASHDRLTFFAGALLGIAGGAIVAAVQEALHGRD